MNLQRKNRFTISINNYEYYKYKLNKLKSSQNIVHHDENTKNFAPIHRRGVKNVLKMDFFLENC